MIDGVNNLGVGNVGGRPGGAPTKGGGGGGANFSEMLKNSIDEVSRMQQDASKAVEDLASGKTEDVTKVMTAMEKSDMAFKTLLSIRNKLMEAYEEIKGISI